MTTCEWISMLLAPVTGVASWLAATRLRQNRTIPRVPPPTVTPAEDNTRGYS